MIDPALFNQRNKQGACLFQTANAVRFAGGRVSVALDSRRRGYDQGVAGHASGCGRGCSGSDDADDGDVVRGRSRIDFVEGKGAGGVAGDDQEFAALIDEETGAGDGVASDGRLRLGAVGKTSGVAEVEV